jgi:signal peptidase I
MTSQQILILFLIQSVVVLLPVAGLYKMFEKAGLSPWKALVPYYNTWIMLKSAGRPKYLFFCQFIPIVGWFISMWIFIEFVKLFGRFRFYQHALAAILPLFYFVYLGFSRKVSFAGPVKVDAYKRTAIREWADAAIFAIIAATLIRTFVFEAYAIPTGSMEKTLLINDYLFVSKMSYGPRIPNTPLAAPFIHNQLPFTRLPSYIEWVKIPYIRWFASPVRRNDVVVFNLPVNDTLIDRDDYDSKDPYYDVIRREGRGDLDEGRKVVLSDPEEYPIRVRPVDKQENYVKRCIAVPGDILEIRDQVVYINGHPTEIPPNSETFYDVKTFGQPLDESIMKEEYQVDIEKQEEFVPGSIPNEYHLLLTRAARQRMLENKVAKSISPDIDSSRAPGQVFPYDQLHSWTVDEYGPVWVPQKGSVIELTQANYALYERIIRTYEGNKLETKNGIFYINDQPTTQYRFKMDYFWMMGDNRHNSQDSRFWGFVPEDHIVGKASFIFMSWDQGIRWSRLLRGIK